MYVSVHVYICMCVYMHMCICVYVCLRVPASYESNDVLYNGPSATDQPSSVRVAEENTKQKSAKSIIIVGVRDLVLVYTTGVYSTTNAVIQRALNVKRYKTSLIIR
ncbi:hypothetical protein EVAR_50298_1 [Eumeta japonica]|uniref:Uncharacterized protein n=1 Tax=Eumeta variegata TaxID=151549 RepID=A0A4C1XUR8_EUMVA|nr:hypothetical protein EVAR_50298_1 [Eumeta japonica]